MLRMKGVVVGGAPVQYWNTCQNVHRICMYGGEMVGFMNCHRFKAFDRNFLADLWPTLYENESHEAVGSGQGRACGSFWGSSSSS